VKRCTWVDETLAKIVAETHSKPDDALRGKRLAEAWREIQDASLKREAWEDIRARWEEKGWWHDPRGGAAKLARAIYEVGE
jgi:CRISPR-associated protein Csm5